MPALWQVQDCQAIWLKDSRLRRAENYIAMSNPTSARQVKSSADSVHPAHERRLPMTVEVFKTLSLLASVHQPITYHDIP